VTEVKDPSHGNNQGYESQICCSLDHADKCQRFDIATTIREARIDFRSLIDNPDPGNNDDDDGLSQNPEEEDPPSIFSTTADLLTQIWPAAPVAGTIWQNSNLRTLFNEGCTLVLRCHLEPLYRAIQHYI
jgi:hypothetical protein